MEALPAGNSINGIEGIEAMNAIEISRDSVYSIVKRKRLNSKEVRYRLGFESLLRHQQHKIKHLLMVYLPAVLLYGCFPSTCSASTM